MRNQKLDAPLETPFFLKTLEKENPKSKPNENAKSESDYQSTNKTINELRKTTSLPIKDKYRKV